MKKLVHSGVALLLLAAVIGAGMRLWPGRDAASKAPGIGAAAELRQVLDASKADADAATLALEATLRAAHAQADASWWERPLSEVFGQLQAAAAAGDAQAAYVLGLRSAACVQALRERTPEVLLAESRREAEWAADSDDPGNAASRLQNTNRQLRRELETYEDCAVLPEEDLSRYLSWLARAGHAGLDEARLAYVGHAMDDYAGDRGALIAGIEVASERRTLARQWLEQMMRAGNEQALAAYVEASGGGDGLYAEDFATTATYRYALDLVRSRRMEALHRRMEALGSPARRERTFAQLWAQGPIRYGDQLTSQQWDEVAVRGKQIFRESFEHMPPAAAPKR